MIVVIGSRMTWATATAGGATVAQPGLPAVSLGGGTYRFDAGDLGAGYLFGLGLLAAFVPLGWLVTGPRGRIALSAAAVALAAGIVVGIVVTRDDAPGRARDFARERGAADVRVSTGAGIPVSGAGAVVIVLSAIAGAVAGKNLPRMRMPEQPPQ